MYQRVVFIDKYKCKLPGAGGGAGVDGDTIIGGNKNVNRQLFSIVKRYLE